MATSKVYPHDPLVELVPDVFFVHGSMRMGPGMLINRNMAVVRHGTEVTLVNPIRLSPEGEAELEALGIVGASAVRPTIRSPRGRSTSAKRARSPSPMRGSSSSTRP
jgi:hypothetical protein